MSDTFISEIQDLIGKQVEAYTTESRETIHFADFSHERTCVLRGKLLAANGSCFVIEIKHPKTKEPHKIYVQSWHINAIMEHVSGISIGDFYTEDGIVKRGR